MMAEAMAPSREEEEEGAQTALSSILSLRKACISMASLGFGENWCRAVC